MNEIKILGASSTQYPTKSPPLTRIRKKKEQNYVA